MRRKLKFFNVNNSKQLQTNSFLIINSLQRSFVIHSFILLLFNVFLYSFFCHYSLIKSHLHLNLIYGNFIHLPHRELCLSYYRNSTSLKTRNKRQCILARWRYKETRQVRKVNKMKMEWNYKDSICIQNSGKSLVVSVYVEQGN